MKIGDTAEPKIETRTNTNQSKELWEFRLFAIQTLSNTGKRAERLWQEFIQDFESRATVPPEELISDLKECMWAFADEEYYEAAAGVRDFIQEQNLNERP